MYKIFKKLSLLVALLIHSQLIFANNVKITGLAVSNNGRNVSFQIGWDNAWNLENSLVAPFNKDAAWVFLKYKNSAGIWQHLNPDSVNIQQPESEQVCSLAQDKKGFFLYKRNFGQGNIGIHTVNVFFDQTLPSGSVSIKVFAIEMAHVRQSGFWLGDSASQNSFRNALKDAPIFIGNDDSLTAALSGSRSILYAGPSSFPSVSVPVDWPLGFNAFYCMKNEITTAQYTDFLNSLTATQQAPRVACSIFLSAAGTPALANNAAARFRSPIVLSQAANSNGQPAIFACNANQNNFLNDSEDGQHRACNFLSWADALAYLDWAALRPMSETEFEKAARGPLLPVIKEFAWGNQLAIDANIPLFDGSTNEIASEIAPLGYGLTNHALTFNVPYLQGPFRVGFAAKNGTSRIASGMGYYGICDLSGNLWEQCVALNAAGIGFESACGDGMIAANGFANQPKWPDAQGAIFRGGSWNSLVFNQINYEFRDLAISDRFYLGTYPLMRLNTAGARGVR